MKQPHFVHEPIFHAALGVTTLAGFMSAAMGDSTYQLQPASASPMHYLMRKGLN